MSQADTIDAQQFAKLLGVHVVIFRRYLRMNRVPLRPVSGTARSRKNPRLWDRQAAEAWVREFGAAMVGTRAKTIRGQCAVCDVPFVQTHGGTVRAFCSLACQKKFNRRKHRSTVHAKAATERRPCRICGVPMGKPPTVRAWPVTCSAACRKENVKRKSHERYLKRKNQPNHRDRTRKGNAHHRHRMRTDPDYRARYYERRRKRYARDDAFRAKHRAKCDARETRNRQRDREFTMLADLARLESAAARGDE